MKTICNQSFDIFLSSRIWWSTQFRFVLHQIWVVRYPENSGSDLALITTQCRECRESEWYSNLFWAQMRCIAREAFSLLPFLLPCLHHQQETPEVSKWGIPQGEGVTERQQMMWQEIHLPPRNGGKKKALGQSIKAGLLSRANFSIRGCVKLLRRLEAVRCRIHAATFMTQIWSTERLTV